MKAGCTTSTLIIRFEHEATKRNQFQVVSIRNVFKARRSAGKPIDYSTKSASHGPSPVTWISEAATAHTVCTAPRALT